MYIANHSVRVGGKIYMRGETIPEGLPKLKLDWLLSVKAIRYVADKNVGNITESTDREKEQEAAEKAAEPEAPELNEDAEAEMEEAEAPVIDVMSGIVQEEEKPEKKSGAKKTAERRKAK